MSRPPDVAGLRKADFTVVLVSPEIPQNAGNIARLCAAAGVALCLVRPLGFFLDDRHVRRAGLDYWDMVDVRLFDDFTALTDAHPGARLIMATTKGSAPHSGVEYVAGDLLVFGAESKGLPADILARSDAQLVRVPMQPGARSLNLANSVAIVLYEALRQTDYPGLEPQRTHIGFE